MNTILWGGILLGVLVFVHELGHFIVAKLSGVRVLTFSLGFGPRLFGFVRGDTDYRISAIPLGGYVRMYGDDITQEIPEEERDKSFLHKPTFQKSAIAFAGPAANFLLPIGLFFFLFVGAETVSSARVGTVVPEHPAAEAGLLAGDVLVEIDGQPVSTFTEVQKLIEARPGVSTPVVVERAGKRLPLNITPDAVPSFNPLEKDEKLGRVGVMPNVQRALVRVLPGSPAAASGLADGDEVIEVAGEKVADLEQMLAALERATAPVALRIKKDPLGAAERGEEVSEVEVTLAARRPAEEAVAQFQADQPDGLKGDRFAVTAEELAQGDLAARWEQTRRAAADVLFTATKRFGVLRREGTIALVQEETPAAYLGLELGDTVLAVDGRPVWVASEVSTRLLEKPDDVHSIAVLSKGGKFKTATFRLAPEKQRGREEFKTFGGYPGGDGYASGETITRTVGVVEAFQRATRETGKWIAVTAKSLWMLVTGDVSPKSLGGPITIVRIAGQAAESGATSFINLMAFISVNLAIINLLPIPVLDGGHLMMFGIEAISRQRISLRTRERATKVGFAMLLCLLAVALFNDVLGLL
jgi:regulator of sigma E protease